MPRSCRCRCHSSSSGVSCHEFYPPKTCNFLAYYAANNVLKTFHAVSFARTRLELRRVASSYVCWSSMSSIMQPLGSCMSIIFGFKHFYCLHLGARLGQHFPPRPHARQSCGLWPKPGRKARRKVSCVLCVHPRSLIHCSHSRRNLASPASLWNTINAHTTCALRIRNVANTSPLSQPKHFS